MGEEINKKLTLERIVILQAIAELELRKKGKESFSVVYPEINDKYGMMNEIQSNILRNYLKEKYEKLNLNIKQQVEEAGEIYSENKISEYEIKELIKEADNIILLTSIILERKERLLNNNKD